MPKHQGVKARVLCALLQSHFVLTSLTLANATQVRSLCSLGHDVMVISGAPPSYSSSPIAEGAKELIEASRRYHCFLMYRCHRWS